MARATPERRFISLRPDGSLKAAVVADTHSTPHRGGLAHLAALKPDLIFHGGDIGDLQVLREFERIAPVHAVRGNIDGATSEVPEALSIELQESEQTVLRLLLLHIALAGPRLRPDAARLAKEAKASLVLCGHSHVPFLGVDRGLTIFNPGSIGPKRFALPILFGVMEVSATSVSLHHVSAETGQRWQPGPL